VTEERDPYTILGVSPGASDDEVRKAYHARARHLHPDVVGESGLDEMRALNEAWAVLKDPQKRAAHDSAKGHSRGGAAGATDGNAESGSGGASEARRSFAGQPHWTGAAGPPPGRPWGTVLEAGIYAGWSLGEIARRDRGYLAWLRDRPEGRKLRDEIGRILESGSVETREGSRSKGGKRP
jgi:curved DNA-binding protein CbpA